MQDLAFMLSVAWTVLQLLATSFFIGTQDLAIPWLKGLRYVSRQRGCSFQLVLLLRCCARKCALTRQSHAHKLHAARC